MVRAAARRVEQEEATSASKWDEAVEAVLARAKVSDGVARVRLRYGYSTLGRALAEAGHVTGSREYAIGADPFNRRQRRRNSGGGGRRAVPAADYYAAAATIHSQSVNANQSTSCKLEACRLGAPQAKTILWFSSGFKGYLPGRNR